MKVVVAFLISATAPLAFGFRLAFANRVKSLVADRESRLDMNSSFFSSEVSESGSNNSGSLHDGVHDIFRDARRSVSVGSQSSQKLALKKSSQPLLLKGPSENRLVVRESSQPLALKGPSENRLVVRESSQPLALKGPSENRLIVHKGHESSQRQIIPVDRLSSSRGSHELDELLTMGSMVSSSFDIDAIEDLHDVELVQSQRGSRALAFNKGSGALELQPANVVKMHLITTQVEFLPGNLQYGKKKFPDNELKAKKYGEAVKSPEVCTALAEEIQELQATAPTGSKFVICVSLGTSASLRYLTKQERPDFALNRATSVKTCLEEALEAAEFETPAKVKDPMVQYKKDRVAALLMKSYTGEAEPACSPSEITIPDV